jgi:TonB family protein
LAAEQAQFEETLAEWNALQEELQATASSSTARPSAADQRATQQSAASLANDLSRLTAAIQASSRNVVTTGSDAPARQSPNADPMRGDGSGIAIGDGAGTRVRTSGSPVTLDGISLGAAFPPSYPVVVDFTVDAAGRVLRPTVRVPSPEPALDRRITETVATWIFESAPAGSPPVRGSVTIVVDASTAR